MLRKQTEIQKLVLLSLQVHVMTSLNASVCLNIVYNLLTSRIAWSKQSWLGHLD